jgi:hypothetical protein
MPTGRDRARWEKQIADWNARFPPGTPVEVTIVRGQPPIVTKTNSKAWALGHGEGVVSIEGKSGGYGLDFVKPIAGGAS